MERKGKCKYYNKIKVFLGMASNISRPDFCQCFVEKKRWKLRIIVIE